MSASEAARARLARGDERMRQLRKSPDSPDSVIGQIDGPSSPASPPSSLARVMTQRLTPSQRMAEDLDRMKALTERKLGKVTPGPGAYDPKVTEKGDGLEANAYTTQSHNVSAQKGTAAFGVKVEARESFEPGKTVASGWAVPGTFDSGIYNPNVNREIAHDAKQSFQKSNQGGKGSFGNVSKRDLRLEALQNTTKPLRAGMLVQGDETPAGAAYNPLQNETGTEYSMAVMSSGEKMQSAAFKSTTTRPGMAAPNAKINPAPNAYDVKFETQDFGGNKGKMSKFGRGTKFTSDHLDGTGDDCTTGALIGPGSYSPVRNKSGGHDSIEQEGGSLIDRGKKYKIENKDGDKLAFNATGPQRELPFEARYGVASKKITNTKTAPGQYDPKVTEKGDGLAANAHTTESHNVSAKKGTAAFGVKVEARQSFEPGKVQPAGWAVPGTFDSGIYNPNVNREIAHDAKQSFQKSNQGGKGSFGNVSKRDLRLEALQNTTKPLRAGMLVQGDETPAGAAYNPLQNETGTEYSMAVMSSGEKMQSAAFKSTTTRPGMAAPNAKINPAPNAYDVKFETQDFGGNKGKMSKFGRGTKFTSDHLDGTGDDCTTGALIGPGSYTPYRNKSGDYDTILIKADVEVITGVGTNAVFTSGSLRSPVKSPTSVMAW